MNSIMFELKKKISTNANTDRGVREIWINKINKCGLDKHGFIKAIKPKLKQKALIRTCSLLKEDYIKHFEDSVTH